MSLLTGIRQKYANLTILYPSGCAAVLSFYSSRVFPLFEKARLIDYQYAIVLSQVLTYIPTQLITHSVHIPGTAIQKIHSLLFFNGSE